MMNSQNLASKSLVNNQHSVKSEAIMGNFKMRPFNFSDKDYQDAVNVWNAVWPDEKTKVENMKHSDEGKEGKFWRRVMCEQNGQVVGFGYYSKTWWSKRKGQYFLTFQTHPDYRNQGMGSHFYNEAIADMSNQGDLEVLLADTREDEKAAVNFLVNRGFKQVMRYPRSVIDVQAFQPEKFQPLVSKLNDSGIEIMNVNQLKERYDDYQKRIYDLECEIDKDIPSPDPFESDPFEEYQKNLFGSPNFYPEAWAVAVDNDAFVGLSCLWKRVEDNMLATGLTGVLRSHRRIGLATALKASALAFAKSKGIEEIDTDNEENNPMYQLNLQLGFKPAPGYIDFQKEIK